MTMNTKRPAAIWARVSTTDQAAASLPSQVEHTTKLLLERGYSTKPELVFSVDWSSLDLTNCPQFGELYQLVQRREIGAIAVLDRDRLHADGLDRMVFMKACKEHDVELLLCQGPPLVDGNAGDLMEFVLTFGKREAVMRASTGSKAGLRDRVVMHKKAVTKHRVYGYRWDGDQKLVHDTYWINVKQMFDMALEGKPMGYISKELARRGILTPNGHKTWPKSTISGILHNPIYAGCYYGLKTSVRVPVKRNKATTYGKSSRDLLSLDQAVYVPEIEIADPPITWEQRETILENIKLNLTYSPRNARHEYLLSGMVFCSEHMRADGTPRKYTAHRKPPTWRYFCPDKDGCRKSVAGPPLERTVKKRIQGLLNTQDDHWFQSLNADPGGPTVSSLEREIAELKGRRARNVSQELLLLEKRMSDTISDEVYDTKQYEIVTQREWFDNRQDELLDQIANLKRKEDMRVGLDEIRLRFFKRTLDGSITFEEWRELFKALHLRVTIYPRQEVDYDPNVKIDLSEDRLRAFTAMQYHNRAWLEQYIRDLYWAGDAEISVEIPMPGEAEYDAIIALSDPRAGGRNNTYPIRLPIGTTDEHPAESLENARPGAAPDVTSQREIRRPPDD